MRRKLFCTLMVVMICLFLLEFMGIPLTNSGLEGLMGINGRFTGIVEKIQYKDDENYRMEVKLTSVNGLKVNFRGKVLVNFYGILEEPWNYYNEEILFHAQINQPEGQRNPRCFDYRQYLKSRDIFAVASVTSFDIEANNLSLKQKYEKWLFRQRCLFEKSLYQETKGIIMGVLFGDTACLDEDLYEDFRNNGTAHILAVSGLHVGILYNLYKKTAGRKNSPKALILLVFLLFSYGTLSMWSPSVTRATMMIAMSVLARLLDLRYDMLTAMSAVAMVLIAANPYVIFGAGFQMSFLAISSIGFIRPVIPDKIPEFLTAPLAVNLGLLPYQIYQFNYISLVSVAANLPVVFLTGYFVPLAVLAFVVFIICGDMLILRPAVEGMAMLITGINKLSTLGGYGSVEVASPPLWLVIMLSGLTFFFSSETFAIMKARKNMRKILLCILAAAVLSVSCGWFVRSPLSDADIVFVDVGQGDCLHIREGKTDILIDGGGSISYNVGKKTLKPYLLKNGASDVDMAIATHMHMDHFKGLEELEEVFEVKELMTCMTAGKIIKVSDNLTIETIWPETIVGGQEENSQCSVFIVYFHDYKILVTGDLDEAGEKCIIKKYSGTDKLKSDIMKIGHHGSRTSTCDAFLEAVSPEYAVIQVGKNNYGHPNAEIVEKCLNNGIITLRNDYNGAVGFSFDKKGILCSTMIDRKD